MKSLKDALVLIVGLVALGFGGYKFYLFVNTNGPDATDMWWAIACAVVFFVCGLIYFLGRVNKEEEIHITQ
jgi:hypothetical protein